MRLRAVLEFILIFGVGILAYHARSGMGNSGAAILAILVVLVGISMNRLERR